MSEVWMQVPGFPLYEVSDLGRVRHIRRRAKVLQASVVNKHLQVSLYIDGVQKGLRVHRLVLEAFVGPMPRGKQTAHLNGNPFDNRLDNLIYATPKENNDHKYVHGTIRFGERHPKARLSEKDVLEIRRIYRRYSKDSNAVILAKRYNVATSTINMILCGENWSWLKDEKSA